MAGLTSEQLAQVKELIGQETQYLALPHVRGLVNQLSSACETWCPPNSRATDFPPQPAAQLQGWAVEYLGQGYTAADVKRAFQDLRQSRNDAQHLPSVEAILGAIVQLRSDINMPALQARDPFLHAAMAGAEDFVECFLAE